MRETDDADVQMQAAAARREIDGDGARAGRKTSSRQDKTKMQAKMAPKQTKTLRCGSHSPASVGRQSFYSTAHLTVKLIH